ncbi:MAG: recombinase family protein [Mucinivorans sp.]
MKKGYIQSINSVVEFQEVVAAMNKVGIQANDIAINPSFSDFIQTASAGDCVVVYNLDFFQSLAELMDTTIELAQRDITIQSLSDTWYNISPEMANLLIGIHNFDKRIRANRTRQGLSKAKADGKILGRPVGSTKTGGKIGAVTKLRKESNMSIAQACEVAKCNPRTYYRNVNKE